MSMLTLIQRLRARGGDTADTSLPLTEVAGEALPLLAMPPATPDTCAGDRVPQLSSGDVGSLCAHVAITSAAVRSGECGKRAALLLVHQVAAEEVAELVVRLAHRDLRADDRRLCLECAHLSGTPQARRCDHWRVTGMRGPAIPGELVYLLQRCIGFVEATCATPADLTMLRVDPVPDAALIEENGDG